MSVASPGAPAAPQFATIPVSKIDPSPTNPRKFFKQEQLDELAASITTQGVLEPLLVRASKKGRFELIAGERRWRAATQAKLKEVPAVVREMTDEQVLDAQIHENLHRADVHPMDEAFGYQHLLKAVEGLSVEELARRVGKSPRYVARRLSLTTLIEPAVKDFMDGAITAGHAEQLSRLAPEVQARALDQCYKQEFVRYDSQAGRQIFRPLKDQPRTVGELIYWINENVALDLKRAPWSLDDATLVPEQGPCSSCPFNTAANQLLWGDAAQAAICTNPEGFKRKMQAWIALQVEKLKAAGAGQVLYLDSQFTYLDAGQKKARDMPSETLGRSEYVLAEKKSARCEFTLPAVFVHGDRRGQTAWACVEPKCKDHKGRKETSSSGGSVGGQRVEKTPAEQKKMRERKQELFDARIAEPVRLRTLRALLDKVNPECYADRPGEVVWPLGRDYFVRMAVEHFERIPSDTQAVMYDVLGWQEIKQAKGDSWRLGDVKQKKAVEHVRTLDDVSLVRFMFLCSVAHYGENLNITGRRDQSKVIELAEQHGVPYRLFDARERSNQSPGKKYHGAHRRHLLQVLLGLDVKRPEIYTDEKTWNVSTVATDLERQVAELITPTPALDGPEGVNLPGARVRFIAGELAGRTGELLSTANVTDGPLSKVKLDDGGEVEAHISTLVYAEGVFAELRKRQPRQEAKAEASAPAKKVAAKRSPAKKAGKAAKKKARAKK